MSSLQAPAPGCPLAGYRLHCAACAVHAGLCSQRGMAGRRPLGLHTRLHLASTSSAADQRSTPSEVLHHLRDVCCCPETGHCPCSMSDVHRHVLGCPAARSWAGLGQPRSCAACQICMSPTATMSMPGPAQQLCKEPHLVEPVLLLCNAGMGIPESAHELCGMPACWTLPRCLAGQPWASQGLHGTWRLCGQTPSQRTRMGSHPAALPSQTRECAYGWAASSGTAASSSPPLRRLPMPTPGRLLSLTAAPMLPQVCCLPCSAAFQAFTAPPPGCTRWCIIIGQPGLLLFVA